MSQPYPTPLISVVLATHNRAGLLGRAIDSVLAQRYEALELIVVDDGSTDDTTTVLRLYADRRQVRILRNHENRGLPAALNRGVMESHGEFVARIDDDDFWSAPDKLAKQVEFMRREPRCGLLGTAYIDEWGRTITNPTDDATIRHQMLFRCPFCHSSVLIRRAAFDDSGAYDERLAYAEDWDLWMRIGRQWKVANLADVAVVKEQGSTTLSERNFQHQLGMAGKFVRRYADAYPRASQACVYHTLCHAIFTLFPPGGGMHKLMRKAFVRTFGLQRDAG